MIAADTVAKASQDDFSRNIKHHLSPRQYHFSTIPQPFKETMKRQPQTKGSTLAKKTQTVPEYYLDSLRELPSKSLSEAEVLREILTCVSRSFSAEFGLLYLSDDEILQGIQPNIDEPANPLPTWSSAAILAATFNVTQNQHPRSILNHHLLQPVDPNNVDTSLDYWWQDADCLSTGITPRPGNRYLVLDSKKQNLCQGILVLSVATSTLDDSQLQHASLYLTSVIGSLEAAFRRTIHKLNDLLLRGGETILRAYPGGIFQEVFAGVCNCLGVSGASLFVRELGQASESMQIVATFPKDLPKDRKLFPNYLGRNYSPTRVVVSEERSCIVPSVATFRASVEKTLPTLFEKSPIWCDLPDETGDRCLAFALHRTREDLVYVFRCTNSKINPSPTFHVLDRSRIQEITTTLALHHRAMENEFRAVALFSHVSHDFRQRLQGILSAANYVRKTLDPSRNTTPTEARERIFKLTHIKTTAKNLVGMLERFCYPFPSLVQGADVKKAFKAYADLVKPVCEMFHSRAVDRRIIFRYHGKDQLRPLYSDLSEWQQVVENLVSNAVKYTMPEEEVMIAFERIKDGGGGAIHFASVSLPIDDDEVFHLFDYHFRGRAANLSTAQGEGLGLTIAQFITNRYGAKIIFRRDGKINIFSILLPIHLFRKE